MNKIATIIALMSTLTASADELKTSSGTTYSGPIFGSVVVDCKGTASQIDCDETRNETAAKLEEKGLIVMESMLVFANNGYGRPQIRFIVIKR